MTGLPLTVALNVTLVITLLLVGGPSAPRLNANAPVWATSPLFWMLMFDALVMIGASSWKLTRPPIAVEAELESPSASVTVAVARMAPLAIDTDSSGVSGSGCLIDRYWTMLSWPVAGSIEI